MHSDFFGLCMYVFCLYHKLQRGGYQSIYNTRRVFWPGCVVSFVVDLRAWTRLLVLEECAHARTHTIVPRDDHNNLRSSIYGVHRHGADECGGGSEPLEIKNKSHSGLANRHERQCAAILWEVYFELFWLASCIELWVFVAVRWTRLFTDSFYGGLLVSSRHCSSISRFKFLRNWKSKNKHFKKVQIKPNSITINGNISDLYIYLLYHIYNFNIRLVCMRNVICGQ